MNKDIKNIIIKFFLTLIIIIILFVVITIAENNIKISEQTLDTTINYYPKHLVNTSGFLFSDYVDSAPECKIYKDYKECIIHLMIETESNTKAFGAQYKTDKWSTGNYHWDISNEGILFVPDFKVWDYQLLSSEVTYEKVKSEYQGLADCEYNVSQLINEICLDDNCRQEHTYLYDEFCADYIFYTKKPVFNFTPTTISDATYISTLPKTTLGTIQSACGTINAAGYYELNQSITAAGSCLIVTASNVDIDCKGYMINYSTAGAGIGIDLNLAGGTNLTVRNCVIEGKTSSAQETVRSGYGWTQNQDAIYLYNNTLNNSLANDNIIHIDTQSYGYDINGLIYNNTLYGDGNSIASTNRGDYMNYTNNRIYNGGINTRGKVTSNNWINQGYATAIGMGSNAADGIINNNTVVNCTNQYGACVSLSAFDRGTLSNNNFQFYSPLYGTGISLYSSPDVQVINNTINMTRHNYFLYGSPFYSDSNSNLYIKNLSIYAENFTNANQANYRTAGLRLFATSGTTVDELYMVFGGSGTVTTDWCSVVYDDANVNTYMNITLINTHNDCHTMYFPTGRKSEVYYAYINNTKYYDVDITGTSYVTLFNPIYINRSNMRAENTSRIYINHNVTTYVNQSDYGWAIGDAAVTFYNENESKTEAGGLTNISGWTRSMSIPECKIDSGGYKAYEYTANAVTAPALGYYKNESFYINDTMIWYAAIPYDVGILNEYDMDCVRNLNAGEDELICAITMIDPSRYPIEGATGTWAMRDTAENVVATGVMTEWGLGTYFFNYTIPDTLAGAYYVILNSSAAPTSLIEAVKVVNSTRICKYNKLVINPP